MGHDSRHAQPHGQFETMRARWQRVLTITIAILTVWLVPANGQTQPPGESADPPTTAATKPVSVLHFPADTDQVVVPLVESNGLLLTRDVKVNGQTLDGWWFIDTGAAFSALDEMAARKLMLAIAPDPLPHLNETVKAEFYRIDSISLGPIRLSNHAILSLNVRSFGKQLNMNIVGIIGADLWGAMPFRIDGRGKQLVLFSREHFQPPDDTPAHDISLDREPPSEEAIYFRANPFAGRAIASGRIDDVPCRMMIDTGLSMGIFLLPSFVKDHPDFVDHSGPGHWPLTGFPGVSDTRRAMIDKLRVFGRTVPQPRKAIATLEATDVFDALDYDGVIGEPLLRDFRLTFDYAKKTVWATWAPPPTMSEQLANGLDPNERNVAGLTPLHRAIAQDHQEAARLFVAHKARPDAFAAAGLGDQQRLAELLRADPELVGRKLGPYGTPLAWAAAAGKLKTLGLLLGYRADVNAAGKYGSTPLYRAARHGHATAIRVLIHAGANADGGADRKGDSPLHAAVRYAEADAATALLEEGADPNVTGLYKVTPLHLAAERGRAEIVACLLRHGAEATAETFYGRTPLAEVVERFPQRGGRTAEAWAKASSPYLKVARMLLEHRADPLHQHTRGETPLGHARQEIHSPDLIKLLEDAARPTRSSGSPSDPAPPEDGRP